MRVHHHIFLSLISVLLLSCQDDDGPSRSFDNGSPPDWLIPEHRVFDGGPGKDGIPSLNNPSFVSLEEGDTFLEPDELVVGLKFGDEVRAYPHKILDWHELVNDSLGGVPVVLNYCPLTGTANCWDRRLKLGVTTFGVSGLIFNSNLIPFDRETESNWSQLLGKSVNGFYQGEEVREYPVLETSWETWKKMYPESVVLSIETGFDRTYGIYPYGDYLEQDDRLFFPIVPLDQRMPLKERVLGLELNGTQRVYRQSAFGAETIVFNDLFQTEAVVIAGNKSENWFVAFSSETNDGSILSFSKSDKGYPVIMTDQEGNDWDAFGYAINGPRKGDRLRFHTSLMGYWLGLSSFFPASEIVESF